MTLIEVITGKPCNETNDMVAYLKNKNVVVEKIPLKNLSDDQIENVMDQLGTNMVIPMACNPETKKCVAGFKPDEIDKII